MWSLLPQRLQLLAIAIPTIVIVLAIEAVMDIAIGQPSHPLRSTSLAVFFIGAFLIPSANKIWRPIWRRFPAIERAIFPDLNGTWEGTIDTTWARPDTGAAPPPIPTIIRINQSLFFTTVCSQTGESRSQSTRCYLEADRAAGIYSVRYSYANRPKAMVSRSSPRHDGFAWLELNIEADPNRLIGQYFTERRTTGDIELRRVETK